MEALTGSVYIYTNFWEDLLEVCLFSEFFDLFDFLPEACAGERTLLEFLFENLEIVDWRECKDTLDADLMALILDPLDIWASLYTDIYCFLISC